MSKIELPAPSPDKNLYDSNLLAGFNYFPKRKKNYERYQQSKKTKKLDYLPIKLDIENVSRCNFHCKMCSVSEWPGLKRADDMSFESFKNLLETQHGVIEIKLQGLGEPLMGKSWYEMIKYARERYIWVRSITNGSLLHLKENYKKMIDSDVCELQVSIDGATKETFEKIRRGGKFTQIAKNCTMLNDYALQKGKKRTRMWSLIQKDNFHELELLVSIAKEWGFDRLTYGMNVEDQGWKEEHFDEIHELNMVDKFSYKRANDLINIGIDIGVEVTFWGTNDKFDQNVPEKLCSWPFERVVVSSDMRIVPCCMVANPEIYDLGDAKILHKEWNSNSFKDFRQSHIDGELPNICKNCYI